MYLLAVVKRVVKRNWYSKIVGKTDKKVCHQKQIGTL